MARPSSPDLGVDGGGDAACVEVVHRRVRFHRGSEDRVGELVLSLFVEHRHHARRRERPGAEVGDVRVVEQAALDELGVAQRQTLEMREQLGPAARVAGVAPIAALPQVLPALGAFAPAARPTLHEEVGRGERSLAGDDGAVVQHQHQGRDGQGVLETDLVELELVSQVPGGSWAPLLQQGVDAALGLITVEVEGRALAMVVVPEIEDVVPRRRDGMADRHLELLGDLTPDRLSGLAPDRRTVAPRAPRDHREIRHWPPDDQLGEQLHPRQEPTLAPDSARVTLVERGGGGSVRAPPCRQQTQGNDALHRHRGAVPVPRSVYPRSAR